MFLPVVMERASHDYMHMDNVLFTSAKTLNLVFPFERHDGRESKIKPCLEVLRTEVGYEKDADVSYFARIAFTKLACAVAVSHVILSRLVVFVAFFSF